MSYTIWLDVLFVNNLVMDYFLLRQITRICKGKAGCLVSLLGAAFGAAGYCCLILFPVGSPGNTILANMVINTFMVRFGCGLRKVKAILKGVIVLYMTGFLMGGMLQFMKRYAGLKTMSGLLLAGVSCHLTYATVLPVWLEKKKHSQIRYQVRMQRKDRQVAVTAFLDTGNRLVDPVVGEPVSIVRKEILEKLLDTVTWQELEQFQNGKMENGHGERLQELHPHFLTFSSLGCPSGLLTAVTLDTLYLENEEVHKIIHHPVVAFSVEDRSSFGDCQMILHPNLIDS